MSQMPKRLSMPTTGPLSDHYSSPRICAAPGAGLRPIKSSADPDALDECPFYAYGRVLIVYRDGTSRWMKVGYDVKLRKPLHTRVLMTLGIETVGFIASIGVQGTGGGIRERGRRGPCGRT